MFNKKVNSPNASQPVGYERKSSHEQDEHGRAVFRVTVDLPGHPDQAQEARGLQQTDQGGGLKGRHFSLAAQANKVSRDRKWPKHSHIYTR
jgi:hypothetical protein